MHDLFEDVVGTGLEGSVGLHHAYGRTLDKSAVSMQKKQVGDWWIRWSPILN
jgi:hypothetical protein